MIKRRLEFKKKINDYLNEDGTKMSDSKIIDLLIDQIIGLEDIIFSIKRDRICSGCNKLSSDLLQCAKCKEIYYCTRECQLSDWDRHKKVCNKK